MRPTMRLLFNVKPDSGSVMVDTGQEVSITHENP